MANYQNQFLGPVGNVSQADQITIGSVSLSMGSQKDDFVAALRALVNEVNSSGTLPTATKKEAAQELEGAAVAIVNRDEPSKVKSLVDNAERVLKNTDGGLGIATKIATLWPLLAAIL